VIPGLLQPFTNQLTDLLFVVNDKNRRHHTLASMHDSVFPTGCVFKESLPNCTIAGVSRQTNNAASKDSDANIREPFITIVRVALAGEPHFCAKYQARRLTKKVAACARREMCSFWNMLER
jgi:hypothetical protein